MSNPFMTAPFRQFGACVNLSGTTSSSGAALTRPSKEQTCVVVNSGTTLAYVKFGTGSQTATITDIPVAPGTRIFSLLEGDTHVAAIMASGTATISVSVGDGI